MTSLNSVDRADHASPSLRKRIFNQAVASILRSPLHGMMSQKVLVITFQGRKSGRQISTPVGYIEMQDGSIMVFTDGRWWRNLLAHPQVSLWLRGRHVRGRAELCRDTTLNAVFLNQLVKQRGVENARRRGLEAVPTNASDEEVVRLTGNKIFIRIILDN